MDRQTYWQRQDKDRPLFPDLLWSRPENRTMAGKLLIIGGNAYAFAAPAEAFAEAGKAGIGVARVLLPDALKSTVGKVIEAGDFAPSTPSGSFGQKALTEFLVHASWADAVLLAGDLGRNSETAIVLEKFIESYSAPLILTKDAVDYFTAAPAALLRRPHTTLVLSFAQLQKIGISLRFTQPFTFNMDLLHLVDALHAFTESYRVHVIVKHLRNMFVASGGEVSTTLLAEDVDIWRVPTGARASVWWLQNPSRPFPALTTAVYEAAQLKTAG